jgi:flagellar basal-body rod modification protein FlgD
MDLSILSNAASVKTTASQSTNTQSEATSSGSESANSVNEQFDTFLNLLTAQIKNQDPLAPMDSTQFVEQLATFSNLELQAKNTVILEDIASLMAQQLAASTAPTQES